MAIKVESLIGKFQGCGRNGIKPLKNLCRTGRYISVTCAELIPRSCTRRNKSLIPPRRYTPMRKPFAFALMLAAAMGLAACDKASEDKAQDAQQHAEQAQEKMGEAQDKMNEAAKENAEAAKDQAEAQQKAAEEAAPATPAPEAAPATPAPETAPATPAEPAKQ
jgi:hypothetical protein